MIPLAIGVAVLDEHTRLASLETSNSSCRTAAVGTAVDRRIDKMMMVHVVVSWPVVCLFV
jgi:hypothetical protein